MLMFHMYKMNGGYYMGRLIKNNNVLLNDISMKIILILFICISFT